MTFYSLLATLLFLHLLVWPGYVSMLTCLGTRGFYFYWSFLSLFLDYKPFTAYSNRIAFPL